MERIEYNGELWEVIYWVSGDYVIAVRVSDPAPKQTYLIRVESE